MEGDKLVSSVNGRAMVPGRFSLVDDAGEVPRRGRSRIRQVVGEAGAMHLAHPGALFQVASQFNFLEMVGPEVTPADGITRYQWDRTQGPACAIACAAGTIWRNYFVPHGGHRGQCEVQLDGLAALGAALGNADGALWEMRNGYALPGPGGLEAVAARLGVPVFLTLLGGGAFGNDKRWILDALARAFRLHEQAGLEVAVVSYGAADPDVARLVAELG